MTNDVGPKTSAVSVNRSLLADAGNVNGGFDVSPIFRAPFFRERVIVFATATTTSGKARLLTSRRGLPKKMLSPGEEVVAEFKPHWTAILGPLGITLLALWPSSSFSFSRPGQLFVWGPLIVAVLWSC